MKVTCEACESEPSILGATGKASALGEKCYARLLKNNVGWAPKHASE